jgi:tetratricopeptide (TPR) repeat protein
LLLAINAKEAVDTESIEAYSEYSFVLRSLRWMNFGVLLTLAAIGVWLMRDAARRVFILYLMFAAMVLSTALFFVVARYRYPLVPFVVLFAASAISFTPNFRRLSRAQIVVAAVVGIGCAILVSLPVKALGDETFLNVGEELVRLNQPAQALPLLRRAVSIAPISPAPHYNLGLALRQTGNRETSLNEFNEAIRLNPNYFEAHAAKALTLADSGRQTEALVEFREALRLRPDSATTHVGLADSLVNMGDNSDAIVEYQKATELAPELFEAHYRLAQAYVRTNQFAQAVDSLQKALAIANAQGKNELARQIQNGIEMCRARMREENR